MIIDGIDVRPIVMSLQHFLAFCYVAVMRHRGQ